MGWGREVGARIRLSLKHKRLSNVARKVAICNDYYDSRFLPI